jgi:hypothetical protein
LPVPGALTAGGVERHLLHWNGPFTIPNIFIGVILVNGNVNSKIEDNFLVKFNNIQ